MSELCVEPIPAFTDNYLWLLYRAGETAAYVVDPGDAQPVLDALRQRGLSLAGILVTHHHGDHTGGIDTLLKHYPVPVWGPRNPQIPQITHPLREGDHVTVLDAEFRIIEVPGHTLDHIAYFHQPASHQQAGPRQRPLLFCGDTLFAAGCGRLFEGSAATMWASLSKLRALPAATAVYCAHEYTLANLRFARAVEPDNQALARRCAEAEQKRAHNEPTVPSTIELELATNPFLRSTEAPVAAAARQRANNNAAAPAEVFAVIRQWKDSF